MAKIDKLALNKLISQSPSVRKEVEAYAQAFFKQQKYQTLVAFDQHEVTKELNDGPKASNKSGTLGGYGNLFSFIGFYEGSQPAKELRNLFDQIFAYRGVFVKSFTDTSIKYAVEINLPELSDFDGLVMPWESGRGWARGIETNISGINQYLYRRFAAGRSKEGMQSRHTVSSRNFRPTPYISKIINDFRKRVGVSQ